MIKITSTNDVIIVEGDELTRHYPYNGTLVIPKNSTLVILDEASEMVLFKSASNYDTLFTGILGSILIEDEIVTRDNIIEKFNAISNVIVGGNVDLFEVVQSLPTENISDNKVYLVLDSNGSEGNTYVEYLYVNGQWEELGKFKVNIDLSGYATEDWVNSQGFLKEHQDISNLATKEELNTKQDTISDLETIRSGAAKGATALQEVPDTYAKKTDILSAKTDTRYTTYDVQNPVLSGNTIVLQNEVTDSRKYHTLGFDKTVETTENGDVRKYVDFNREFDSNGDPIIHTNFDNYENIPLDFSHITDDGDVLIIYYSGTFVNFETGNAGESFYVYITYNKNTKILKASDNDDITSNQFKRSDTGEYIFNTRNKQFDCNQLPDGAYLIWNIYVSPGLYYNLNVTTQGKLFVGEISTETPTSRFPHNKNEFFRYENGVKAYILTDKNTTFKTINGQQITGNGDITIDTNVDLTGYATEQWVNEQGFLKEHQDISNLATKEELSTKQDTISDLETIRSGAAKGATALQSVPSTYAKKTDILTAKTDTRYTDYDVQNPVLSGKTILLQNEVTDSRKYHTFGYEKTITASVPVQKYINITRNYNGTPSMDTNIEGGIDFSVDSDGVGNMYKQITFTLDKIKNATNLMHYEVSYPERDSEGNVTGCGEQVVADVTYDPNTKLLSIPEGGFGFAQIQRSDTNHYLFGGGTDGNEYLENGRWYYNFEQGPLQEGATLTWYISCTTPHQYCDYSVTINGLFYQEGSVTTDDKPEHLNDYIRYANNVKAYILTDKNTTFKTINGQQITGNGDITIDTNVDLSNLATKEELNAKQDTLVSGTNIKTVNGTSLLGSGNIEVAANVDLSIYATKDELNGKQDSINDLETIRSGAAKGATALQSVPSGYATEQWVNEQGFLKEHQDISNLATKAELATKQDVITDLDSIRSGAALGSTALQSVPSEYALKSEIPDITTKQDTLVSGTNIKTVNGTSLLGSGNIEIAKEWIGTQAQYDALSTKDNNTTYYITE